MRIADELQGRGGCASFDELRQGGFTEHRINAAVERGEIVRLRRGWYGAGLDPGRVSAGRSGGSVTCVSALQLHGVWTMPDDSVHVRIRRGTKVRRRGITVHWTDGRPRCAGIDTVAVAIECAIECLGFEAAVVALDSAVNRGLISASDARALCAATRRGRAIADALDPASESGLETLARLRLRRLQLRVRSQVVIEGIGRVDLLIGDRLVLELDGRAWHDRPGDFEADRRRDRALVAAGFLVLRASYAQVMGDWPTIEQQILGLVRARQHIRRVASR